MFIERSAARIRLVRTLFVLLGVLPCAGLCAWAAVRYSSSHREAIERRCEQVIGLPLDIGSVEHVRPNAMRLRNCRLSSASGGVVLSAPVIDVESSARELRVTLGRLDCGPPLAGVLARLAADWLRQPVRFPVDCVIDVEDFSWRARPPAVEAAGQPGERASPGSRSSGLHVECVAANGSRAVRVRRNVDGMSTPDEVRVVVGAFESPAGHDDSSGKADVRNPEEHAGGKLEVNGTVAEPLPAAVLEALAGLHAGSLPLGAEAAVSGTVNAVLDDSGASGSAQVRIERIDLASAIMHLPHRMAGEALLAIDRLEWIRDRVTVCECQCDVSRGRVGQRLLDAFVSVLGCRPGPAYRSLAREEVRAFDDVSGLLKIDSAGIDLRAKPGWNGSLARIQGLSILDDPQLVVPLDRMAWLLSPPGTAAVPASRATAWLLGLFTIDSAGSAAAAVRPVPSGPAAVQGPDDLSRRPPDQAGRPTSRSGF